MNFRRPLSPSVWMVFLFTASYLMVFPSTQIWFQSPMRVIQHEFDLFVGVLDGTWVSRLVDVRFWGKWLHFVGFSVVGFLFFKLTQSLARDPEAVSTRAIVVFSAFMALVYVVGTPWVSPDAFFYIGSGWLDGHYHLSPYLHAITEVPKYDRDPMFQNIYPGFLGGKTSYGPLFHFIAAQVAKLSFGREKLALALFKALFLALHAACCALVYRLSQAPSRKLSLVLYAGNPLILFTVLTCAHNDVLMVVLTLLCFLALRKKIVFFAGVCIGLSVAIKYVPLLFLPFVCVSLALDRENGEEPSVPAKVRLAPALLFVAGFAGAWAATFAFYPEAISALLRLTRSNGPGIYRNSIFHFFSVMYDLGMPRIRNAERWTFCAFLAGYVGLWIRYLFKAARGERPDPIEAYLLALTAYFVTTLQCIQEWYLLWILSLAFILKPARFGDFGLLLSCVFMPLVIFTVRIGMPMEFGVNAAVYFAVLLCTLELWSRVYRARGTDGYSLFRPSTELRSPK